MGFDTTASNTGVHAGAVTLVEQYLGKAVLWCACQRHELHIKHAADFIFGPTTGPTDKMFKKFRDRWGLLKDRIEYTQLEGFDWGKYKDTLVEKEAKATFDMCTDLLAEETFPREDFKELVQLVLVWLGGVSQVTGKIYGKESLHLKDGPHEDTDYLLVSESKAEYLPAGNFCWCLFLPLVSEVCCCSSCSQPYPHLFQADVRFFRV